MELASEPKLVYQSSLPSHKLTNNIEKMASYHTRSLSFPSKSHPVADQVEEKLCRVRSSQTASTSSLTNKLTDLNNLYNCVEDFLQLPVNQKTQSGSWVDEVLDGSLRLLDVCSTSRDVLAQSKERLQDIQSVLRRRCSGELNISNQVSEYLERCASNYS